MSAARAAAPEPACPKGFSFTKISMSQREWVPERNRLLNRYRLVWVCVED